jgi:uncharacterized membrane protein
VFEELLGLPMHPLVVHLPVVLVPLLVLGSLVYALVPKVRSYVGWVAVGLAVAAPLSAVVAKLSGQAYRDALYGTQQLPADNPVEIHAGYGDVLMWSSIGLGVATLALYGLRRGAGPVQPVRQWVVWVATGLVVVAAAVVAYYVFRVGHSGAEMTHGSRLPG